MKSLLLCLLVSVGVLSTPFIRPASFAVSQSDQSNDVIYYSKASCDSWSFSCDVLLFKESENDLEQIKLNSVPSGISLIVPEADIFDEVVPIVAFDDFWFYPTTPYIYIIPVQMNKMSTTAIWGDTTVQDFWKPFVVAEAVCSTISRVEVTASSITNTLNILYDCEGVTSSQIIRVDLDDVQTAANTLESHQYFDIHPRPVISNLWGFPNSPLYTSVDSPVPGFMENYTTTLTVAYSEVTGQYDNVDYTVSSGIHFGRANAASFNTSQLQYFLDYCVNDECKMLNIEERGMDFLDDFTAVRTSIRFTPLTQADLCYMDDTQCVPPASWSSSLQAFLTTPLGIDLIGASWGRVFISAYFNHHTGEFEDNFAKVATDDIEGLSLMWLNFLVDGVEAVAVDNVLLLQHHSYIEGYEFTSGRVESIVNSPTFQAAHVSMLGLTEPMPLSLPIAAMAAEPACAGWDPTSSTVSRYMRIPFSGSEGSDFDHYTGIGGNKMQQWVSYPTENYSNMRVEMSSVPIQIEACVYGFTRHCHAALRTSSITLDHPYLLDTPCPGGYYCPFADHNESPQPCDEGITGCPGRTTYPFNPDDLYYLRNNDMIVPLYEADFVSLIADFMVVHVASNGFLIGCCVAAPIIAVLIGMLLHKSQAGKGVLKMLSLNAKSAISQDHLDQLAAGKKNSRLPRIGTITSGFIGVVMYTLIIVGLVLGCYIICRFTPDFTTVDNPSNLVTSSSTPIETELTDIDRSMVHQLGYSGMIMNVTLSGVIGMAFFQIESACQDKYGEKCFQDSDYCKGKAAETAFSSVDPCGILIMSEKDVNFDEDYPTDEITSSFQVDLRDKIMDRPIQFKLHFEDISDQEFDFSLSWIRIELYTNRKLLASNFSEHAVDGDIYTVGLHPESPWPETLTSELTEDSEGVPDVTTLIPDITVSIPDRATLNTIDSTSILSGSQLISIRRNVILWDHLNGPEESGIIRLWGDQVHRVGSAFSYSLMDQVTSFLRLTAPEEGSLEVYNVEPDKSGVIVEVTIDDIDVISKVTSYPVVTLTGIVLGAALLYTALSGILATMSTVVDMLIAYLLRPGAERRARRRQQKLKTMNTATRQFPVSI